MDIQQGNVVTSKMMLQLRPGMTKSQVRFIMGTPLIQDSFHSDRWDYFYQMRQGGKIIEQRRVILEFEKEALVRVRGDVIPAGSGQQDLATPATTPESISRQAPGKEDKGLLDRLKFWKSDEEPAVDVGTEGAATVEESAATERPAAGGAPIVLPPAGSTEEMPVESPAATAAPVPADDTDIEAADMPVPAAPVEQPAAPAAVEAPQAAPAPGVETAPLTMPEIEPSGADALPQAPAVKAAPAPAAIEMPAEAVVPAGSLPTEDSADSMQLIFDRDIDLPADSNNPGNVSNPSRAPETDLPPEAAPDFFERMLEKIGF